MCYFRDNKCYLTESAFISSVMTAPKSKIRNNMINGTYKIRILTKDEYNSNSEKEVYTGWGTLVFTNNRELFKHGSLPLYKRVEPDNYIPSNNSQQYYFNAPYQAPSTTTSSSNYNSSSSSNSSNRSSTSSSQSQRSCRLCHGTKKCYTCNGTRRVANGFGLLGYHECPNCKDGLCSHCHGSGLQ